MIIFRHAKVPTTLTLRAGLGHFSMKQFAATLVTVYGQFYIVAPDGVDDATFASLFFFPSSHLIFLVLLVFVPWVALSIRGHTAVNYRDPVREASGGVRVGKRLGCLLSRMAWLWFWWKWRVGGGGEMVVSK